MDPNRLGDLYDIQMLKAQYFRLMDTRQWDAFRDLFTDDLLFFISDSPLPTSPEPTFTADSLVAHLRRSDPAKITVHQGHMPEIVFLDDNNATGIWAMYDWVDDPARAGAWKGYGHYHERYVRSPDGRWRIQWIHLTRLRVNAVPPQPTEPRPAL